MTFIKCHCFIGGLSRDDDISKCNNCTIAIGTPGRLCDLMESNTLYTDEVNTLIFDESDALLSGNLRKTIEYYLFISLIYSKIFDYLPEESQFINFSATYTSLTLETLEKMCKNNVKKVLLDSEDQSLKGVKHFKCLTPTKETKFSTFNEKCKILLTILSSVDFSQCIIFCNQQEQYLFFDYYYYLVEKAYQHI